MSAAAETSDSDDLEALLSGKKPAHIVNPEVLGS